MLQELVGIFFFGGGMTARGDFRRAVLYLVVLVVVSVAGCGGGGGGGGGDGDSLHACTLPCLAESPTLDTTSVLSATGGIVNLTFTLRGDVANVANVVVFLLSTNPLSTNQAGSATILFPTQAENTVAITVNAGTALDDYYPTFAITALSPTNSGSQYFLDPTKSSSRYTYVETVSGVSNVPELTGFSIPVLKVQ